MGDEDKEREANTQMFALVGEAITQWSFIEQTLCNIFTICVTPCPTRAPRMEGDPGYTSFLDSSVPTAAFYSVESFRGKLNVANAAILSRIHDNGSWAQDIRAQWAKLHNKVRKLSMKRNTLAHGTVTPAFQDDEKFYEPQLMPAYGSPDWWAETGAAPPGKQRSPEQVKHVIRAFALMDSKLRCFYKALAQHPRLHDKFDRLTVRRIQSHRRLNPKRAEWIEQKLSSPDQ